MNINKIDLKKIFIQYNNKTKEMSEPIMNQSQQEQLYSRLEFSLTHERTDSDDSYDCDDYDDEYSTFEEDPTPKWDIPIWKGNEKDTDEGKTCNGCIMRVSNSGENLGCIECDPDFWDMPDLVDPDVCDTMDDYDERNDFYDKPDDYYLAERVYMQSELDGEIYDLNCEACELLNAGLVGGKQISHSCMG
jgi:hypothetical protein